MTRKIDAAVQRAQAAGATLETKVTRTFCGRCGTPLTYRNASYVGKSDVTTRSLDDPDAFPPVGHVWASHKLRWIKIGNGLRCLEEGASLS